MYSYYPIRSLFWPIIRSAFSSLLSVARWYCVRGLSATTRSLVAALLPFRLMASGCKSYGVCSHVLSNYLRRLHIMQLETTINAPEAETDERVLALAAFLECDPDDVSETRYDSDVLEAEGGEYLVLTDSEADQKAKEVVLDSLWAFNASFLSGETEIDEDVFTAIQNNNKCESNNDAMLSLIKGTCGVDSFVDSAVSADGRGHFLSQYDGEENEQGEFFIYRTN